MEHTDRPRGTPSISTREPLAVALATGRKSARGAPELTHRFFLVNAKADGKGQAAVRHPHPSFERFNTTQPSREYVTAYGDGAQAKHDADRASVRGILVHENEPECFWTNYRAQTLKGHEHPKMRPSCEGNGDRAKRWMKDRDEFADIPCPGDLCEYRKPGERNGAPTRSPCNPFSILVFQLRFENMPNLPAKYESRGHGTTGALKGFFEDINRQAAALHVVNPSLYGIPFVLTLSRRSNPAQNTKWYEVTMSADFPPGMTLQQFLLRQADERAQLSTKAPLLIGQTPRVTEVMDAEYEDAGSLGAP